MNIRAFKGAVVIFDKPKNGTSYDQNRAAKHLTVGARYTVDHTDVSNWSTTVYFQEIPDVGFNSVLFSDTSVTGSPAVSEANYRLTRIENHYREPRPMSMRVSSDWSKDDVTDHPAIQLGNYYDGMYRNEPEVGKHFIFAFNLVNGKKDPRGDDALVTSEVTKVEGNLIYTKNSVYKLEKL